MSGEGQDHAICLVARILNGLYEIDPEWTGDLVIPWLKPDNPLAEPAWNGLLHGEFPRPEVFQHIKSEFLNSFPHLPGWSWGEQDLGRMHEWLVVSCLRHLNDSAYISYGETRTALRATDDRGRGHCLWHLTRLMRDKGLWRSFVKPFLDYAWPRELKYRTESISRRFAELAFADDDIFPEVADSVLPYLRPLSDLNSVLYKLTRNNRTAIAARFPLHTVKLVNALINKDVRLPQHDISQALDVASMADPSILQNRIWKRLNRIVRQ